MPTARCYNSTVCECVYKIRFSRPHASPSNQRHKQPPHGQQHMTAPHVGMQTRDSFKYLGPRNPGWKRKMPDDSSMCAMYILAKTAFFAYFSSSGREMGPAVTAMAMAIASASTADPPNLAVPQRSSQHSRRGLRPPQQDAASDSFRASDTSLSQSAKCFRHNAWVASHAKLGINMERVVGSGHGRKLKGKVTCIFRPASLAKEWRQFPMPPGAPERHRRIAKEAHRPSLFWGLSFRSVLVSFWLLPEDTPEISKCWHLQLQATRIETISA